MFEISDLKEKKLPDLQEIAQSLGMKKTKTLKKEELIYRIIDFQAENPSLITPAKESLPKEKEKKTKGRTQARVLFYSINRINYALSPINTDSNAISIISLKVN